MSDLESKTFEIIARRLTSDTADGLRRAVYIATEEDTPINLHQELETLSCCIERANSFISNPDDTDEDLAGIRNSRRVLNQHGLNYIPNPLESIDNPEPWLQSFLKTIEVGNIETGTTYRAPEKIKNGDPLGVFQWYLYDGLGRMIAIHLGISNDDKSQEKEADWIGCALTEATVILAEEGNQGAQRVVRSMLDMKFIAGGWLLTDKLVERAKALDQ